jgi:hypothetical protein
MPWTYVPDQLTGYYSSFHRTTDLDFTLYMSRYATLGLAGMLLISLSCCALLIPLLLGVIQGSRQGFDAMKSDVVRMMKASIRKSLVL